MKQVQIRFITLGKKAVVMLFILFTNLTIFGQQQDSALIKNQSTDTTRKDFVSKAKRIGQEETERSILKYKSDRVEIKQKEILETLIKTLQKAKFYLKKDIDTLSINAELDHMDKWFEIAADGVLINKGTAQTHRNLVTTSKIIEELLTRVNENKYRIDTYENNLLNFRYKIDSLYSDSVLYDFPDDSVKLIQYLQKISVLALTIGPIDSALYLANNKIRFLQNRTNLQVFKLSSGLEEIDIYQKELSGKLLHREFTNIWGPVGYIRPFNEILRFSQEKGKLILKFYSQQNAGKIILLIVLIIAAFFFLNGLKQKLITEKILRDDFAGQLILRYPVFSAIMIIVNLFQFIFPSPPFIFSLFLWTLSSISLTVILRNYITKYWLYVLVSILFLFLLAGIDNLILQASRIERWGIFYLALFGIFSGVIILMRGSRGDLKEKLILYFIGLAVILEFASVMANIYGRYNLSKTLMVTGYSNVIIGILFLWTVRLINEALALASSVYTKQERKLFYINFERVGDKAPTLLYILLVVGWFILLGRNVYAFKLIAEPLKDFFYSERSIGNYSFTIINLLIFFIVMAIAVVTSKIVSFFASDKHVIKSPSNNNKKPSIGSWLLLIQVGILGTGTFLALAASGFPMDKITIILGALGVGIGFGLQKLVSNLVSGLIIAFEKPVNVGDVIEISGQTGTMKSIGFRSSVIATGSGADVVVPNGDLLDANLINWTRSDSKKQLEIPLGLAYGTDLEKAKQILLGLFKDDEHILKHPPPFVVFEEFGKSTINIKILFWIKDLREGQSVKSDIIAAIDIAFKEKGIVIPLPQQEIYLHNPESENKKDNSEKKNNAG